MSGTDSSPIATIVQICASHFEVRPPDILSPRRTARLVLARHVAMYLARNVIGASYPMIARCMGNLNHTSVMHGVQRVEALIEAEPSLAAQVEVLLDLTRARTARPIVPAADTAVEAAAVICRRLLTGPMPANMRVTLLDLAITSLEAAKTPDDRASGETA